jgi:hypothetical protein
MNYFRLSVSFAGLWERDTPAIPGSDRGVKILNLRALYRFDGMSWKRLSLRRSECKSSCASTGGAAPVVCVAMGRFPRHRKGVGIAADLPLADHMMV